MPANKLPSNKSNKRASNGASPQKRKVGRRPTKKNGAFSLNGILKNKYAVLTMAVLILAIITVILCIALKPGFSLVSNSIEIEAGTEFKPYDQIKKMKRLDADDIEISGAVDISSLGEYLITYSYEDQKEILTVKVKDSTAPEIIPKKELNFKCGTQFSVEMLADIKDATKCEVKLDTQGQSFLKQGQYGIFISATDAAGNSSRSEIKINIINSDSTPPVISGANNVSITVGSEFDILKDVSVKDDFDPAPTLNADKGNFDPNKAGNYTVVYTAVDSSGNKSTINRVISVVSKNASEFKFVPNGGSVGWDAKGIANEPYLVAVNRAACTVTVYAKDGAGNYTVPYKAFACSVGRHEPDNETPAGRFTTSGRYEWCYMVDGSYGRYAIRIDGPIMFHSVCYYSKDKTNLEYEEYNKLGSPASLGCIRLSVADVKWLYDNCPFAFPVVIYDDASFSGPLGKPDPIRINANDTARRGWDPTDWDENNPWKKQ